MDEVAYVTLILFLITRPLEFKQEAVEKSRGVRGILDLRV